YVINGHVFTFAPPASDFSANLNASLGNAFAPATSNDSNVIPGSVGVGSLGAAIFSSPSQDPATGLFDNYSNVAATLLAVPGALASGAAAINDLGWVVGSLVSSSGQSGFIAIPGAQSVPQGWSSVTSGGYHWVEFNGTLIPSNWPTTVSA